MLFVPTGGNFFFFDKIQPSSRVMQTISTELQGSCGIIFEVLSPLPACIIVTRRRMQLGCLFLPPHLIDDFSPWESPFIPPFLPRS